MDFSVLVGKTLSGISGEKGGDQIVFATTAGEVFRLYHDRDCCVTVSIDDIEGDLSDLTGSPITMAEKSSNSDPREGQDTEDVDSFTWTFYRLATEKGFVVIRWYGESNGYYSESVDFERVEVQS